MKATAIRKMEEVALNTEILKLKEELNGLNSALRLGKEKDTAKSLKIKRNIARMLTVLKEMKPKK